MKPLLDDTLNWDDMVARFVLSPEFTEAWEALKGSGIGSEESTARVTDLIRGSDWHLSRLTEQQGTIMDACAEPEIADRVMAELLIAATSYMVMGIMLGVALTVRRLGGMLEQVVEEEPKPVVN